MSLSSNEAAGRGAWGRAGRGAWVRAGRGAWVRAGRGAWGADSGSPPAIVFLVSNQRGINVAGTVNSSK